MVSYQVASNEEHFVVDGKTQLQCDHSNNESCVNICWFSGATLWMGLYVNVQKLSPSLFREEMSHHSIVSKLMCNGS